MRCLSSYIDIIIIWYYLKDWNYECHTCHWIDDN